ncbi:MAG: hypothetical protein V4691_03775 [Pseudomonadota bacterium]
MIMKIQNTPAQCQENVFQSQEQIFAEALFRADGAGGIISQEKLKECDELYKKKWKDYKDNPQNANVSDSGAMQDIRATRSELGSDTVDQMNKILKRIEKSDDDPDTVSMYEYIEVKRYIASKSA